MHSETENPAAAVAAGGAPNGDHSGEKIGSDNSKSKLTRQQRRQLQKLAEKVDRVTNADRLFFERFPQRRHRVRLASAAEIGQQEIMEGQPLFLPAGCRIFTVVRNISPGVRLRLFVRGIEGAETNLDEATAREIFEGAATAKTWEIESGLRRALEARA